MPKEIYILDQISTFWGISAEDIKKQLSGVDKKEEVIVYVNSPGGEVFEGLAIYNILKEYNITINVIGLAASMASIIALAGKKIIMSSGSMLMIHNPWQWAGGDADYHRKLAKTLDSIKEELMSIYLKRMKISKENLIELMNEEAWLGFEEAKKYNLVDEQTNERPQNLSRINQFVAMLNTDKSNLINNNQRGNQMPDDNTIQELANLKAELETHKDQLKNLQKEKEDLQTKLAEANANVLAVKTAKVKSEIETYVNSLIESKKVLPADKDYLVEDLINKKMSGGDSYDKAVKFYDNIQVNPLTQEISNSDNSKPASLDFNDENELVKQVEAYAKANKLSFADAFDELTAKSEEV